MISAFSYQLDGIFTGATKTRDMRNGAIISLLIFIIATIVLISDSTASIIASAANIGGTNIPMGDLLSNLDKLNNDNFVARAPDSVVVNEKRKQTEYLDSIQKLEENLKSLQS